MNKTNAGVLIGITTALVVVAFLLMLATNAGAASCHTTGRVPFTVPDMSPGCTPGSFVVKTKADICDGRTERPSLPTADLRTILGNYGLISFTGAQGEKDHLEPLVQGGTTDRRNIWPQRELNGFNPKDRLEAYVLRRICDGKPHPMSVAYGYRLFRINWVESFCFYGLARPTDPAQPPCPAILVK